MPIVTSTRSDLKELDGTHVTERMDHVVVQTADGKLAIVRRSELRASLATKLVVRSSRPQIAVHNGELVEVVRPIIPGDNGFSDNVPQVVVANVDGNLFTVQNGELEDKLVPFDSPVKSTRADLKTVNGQSVKVLRSALPGDPGYAVNGPAQYVVQGKDGKEYVVHASEITIPKVVVPGPGVTMVPGPLVPGPMVPGPNGTMVPGPMVPGPLVPGPRPVPGPVTPVTPSPNPAQ